ncbi:nicotinamide N-methyltransferase-like [Lissotriton helveticus]
MATTTSIKELHECFSDTLKTKERYLVSKSDFFDDTITDMFSNFCKIYSSGDVKGDTMIGLSCGPYIYYTLPACKHFNEIIYACSDDKSIQEVKKWLKNEPDAIDWSDAIKKICELQGTGETWIESQDMLQKKVKEVLKCDVTDSNPLSPVTLPQADCLLLAHCLEHFVPDKKSYCEALANVATLLKPGGTLVMSACIEATFYMVGDFKFPILCIDEDFLEEALPKAGFVIDEVNIFHRKAYSLYSIADFKRNVVLKAHKKREM